MSPEEQVEHFKRHKEGRLKVVLRFLAGLNKVKCFSNKATIKQIVKTPSSHGSKYLISSNAVVGIDFIYNGCLRHKMII